MPPNGERNNDMTSDARNPSFLKSKLFWAIVSVPVIALSALVGVWFFGQSTLEGQLAALRAQGLPTTASELNDFYAVPEGTADTTVLWTQAIDAVQFAGIYARGKTLPIVGDVRTPVPAPGEPWAELEAARTLLRKLDAELQIIRKAAVAEGNVRFPIDFSAGIATLLPHTQESRDVARLLLLDAHVSAHDGNDSQALDDVKAIFALSDALRTEPLLISQLVRMANYAIGCDAVERLMPYCNWSDAELESLQTVIRAAKFKQELSNGLCGERAICLTALDQHAFGPLRFMNKQEALRLYASTIDSLSSPWPEALRRHREIGAQINANRSSAFGRLALTAVSLLLPATEQVAIAGARADARQKCLIAAIAAQRFRLRHGRLPETLADIGQELLGASEEPLDLIDPFDGHPLRFKSEESRIIIYSIGDNEQDDGGDFDRDSQQRPPDVGFSVKK